VSNLYTGHNQKGKEFLKSKTNLRIGSTGELEHVITHRDQFAMKEFGKKCKSYATKVRRGELIIKQRSKNCGETRAIKVGIRGDVVILT
jgi:hypothetical protein